MVVRKGELAERVAAKADVKKRDAKAISEATIDVLIEALSNGEIIVLPAAKISMQRKKDLEKGSVIIAKFRVKEQTPKFDSDFNLDDDSEGDDA